MVTTAEDIGIVKKNSKETFDEIELVILTCM